MWAADRRLRGFTSHRFRDQNGLTLQAEWRIMANRFMDTAVFYDTGKSPRAARISISTVEERLRLRRPLPRTLRHALRIESRESPEGRGLIVSTHPIF
jgi:hypothetical protein